MLSVNRCPMVGAPSSSSRTAVDWSIAPAASRAYAASDSNSPTRVGLTATTPVVTFKSPATSEGSPTVVKRPSVIQPLTSVVFSASTYAAKCCWNLASSSDVVSSDADKYVATAASDAVWHFCGSVTFAEAVLAAANTGENSGEFIAGSLNANTFASS